MPDSKYRVKIQTVNEFGKSRWSEDFEFDTYEGTNTYFNSTTKNIKMKYFQ